jgi:hypothetical protein
METTEILLNRIKNLQAQVCILTQLFLVYTPLPFSSEELKGTAFDFLCEDDATQQKVNLLKKLNDNLVEILTEKETNQ